MLGRSSIRFLAWCIGGTIGICLLVIAFNVVVNPYGIWPDLFHGALDKRNARVNSVRLVKAYDLLHGTCPDAVITGMSTVVWGIDPRQYPVPGEKLYNGGIVGSSAIEQYSYVKSYLTQCPNIKKLYVDVNFESFHDARINAPDFVYDRLGRRFPTFSDFLFTSFSRSAVLASIKTLEQNDSGIIDQMIYDRGDGYHRIPPASDEVYKNNFMMYMSNIAIVDFSLDPKQIAFFKELVDFAKGRGMQVEVYFAPIHYWLNYMRRYNSTVPGATARLQDQLKREVANITDFWDFTLYNDVTAEPIDHAQYFVDMIHYRPSTGAMIMGVINGHPLPNTPSNFGVKVTKDTVEQRIREFHADVDHWADVHPENAATIRDAYAHYAPRANR